MRVVSRWCALAAAVAVLGGASRFQGESFHGGARLPLPKSGIVPLGFEVGPITFHELFIQGAPTDPARIAALPADAALKPRPFVITTTSAKDGVQMQFTFAFEDADGKVVYDCVHHDVGQDEDSVNELIPVCVPGIVGTLTPAQWARVTTLNLEVVVQRRK